MTEPSPFRRLKQWLRVCRIWDWGQSKIPFYLAATLLLLPDPGLFQLIGLLAMIAALASFGYGLNEITDRQSDARSGQHNFAAELTPAEHCAFLLLSAGSALVLSLVWAADGMTTIFVLLCLVLSAAYSAPPIRLKEKGISGLFVPAIAQWFLPVFAIAASEPGGWLNPATMIFALLGLALGVRWMCIHQVQDHWRDRVAGVRTYGALGGSLLRIIVLSLVAELALLVLLFLVTWPASRGVIATLLIWAVIDLALNNPLSHWRSRLQSYTAAPLGSFYFLAFPLVMIIAYLVPTLGVWPTAAIAAIVSHSLMWLKRRNDTAKVAGRVADKKVARTPPTGSPLERGLAFLAGRQLASGGFYVRVGSHRDLTDSLGFPCIFETAYVANVVRGMQAWPAAQEIVNRAGEFLRVERESTGSWRYFLRGSLIPEEIDTIACALMLFEQSPQDDAVIERVMNNRGTDGALLTWLSDSEQVPSLRNGIDICVNANVYAMLRQRTMDDRPIRECLEQALVSQSYLKGSPYYHSPFFFLYSMAKMSTEFEPAIQDRLRREIISTVENSPQLDQLESAQACSALMLTRADPEHKQPLLERLLQEQLEDGGWPGCAMCWGLNPDRFWCGSREMVTAFCIEAISLAVPVQTSSAAS